MGEDERHRKLHCSVSGKPNAHTFKINVQLIPPSDPLLATMPSGRDVHTPKTYVPTSLAEDILIKMRAPPDEEELTADASRGSDSEDEDRKAQDPVGAFPGTKGQYTGGDSSYY